MKTDFENYQSCKDSYVQGYKEGTEDAFNLIKKLLQNVLPEILERIKEESIKCFDKKDK